jgi:hypothetical protein
MRSKNVRWDKISELLLSDAILGKSEGRDGVNRTFLLDLANLGETANDMRRFKEKYRSYQWRIETKENAGVPCEWKESQILALRGELRELWGRDDRRNAWMYYSVKWIHRDSALTDHATEPLAEGLRLTGFPRLLGDAATLFSSTRFRLCANACSRPYYIAPRAASKYCSKCKSIGHNESAKNSIARKRAQTKARSAAA